MLTKDWYMNAITRLFGLGIIVFAGSFSSASTSTNTFTVSATVSAACVIGTNNLAFPSYSPTSSSNTDGSTTLNVTCTNGTAYTVGLDAGTGSGSTIETRKMTGASAGSSLAYSLYSNSNRTSVWGSTVGTNTVAGTGSGAAQSLTVYGRIPANQTSVAATTYNDTITVTVTF
jgi:spore coat protein U-like protein